MVRQTQGLFFVHDSVLISCVRKDSVRRRNQIVEARCGVNSGRDTGAKRAVPSIHLSAKTEFLLTVVVRVQRVWWV